MAEAFGIAASVAGIVSLGLELFKGINTYIGAVRGRDEEISAINRQTEVFQGSLKILQSALQDLDMKHQTAGNTMRAALEAGELDLKTLKDFMVKLADSSSQPQSIESRLKHATKMLAYPFHEKPLETLQQRLDRANTSLDVAIRALDLKIISSIEKSSADAVAQLASLSIISATNKSTSVSIKASLDTFIPRTDQALIEVDNSLRTSLPVIQKSLDSISETLLRHEAKLTSKLQEAQSECREETSDVLSQTASSKSIVNTLGATQAGNRNLIPDLFSNGSRAVHILNGLAEKKEHDPPRLLHASAEQRALYRLVSSPAQLEKLLALYQSNDEVNYEFTIAEGKKSPEHLASNIHDEYRYTSTCICRQQHESFRSHTRLGSLSFNILRSTYWKHLPECRFSRSEIVSKSDTIRMTYSGLQWLLPKAIELSISLGTGSGGLSISPTITLRPVVNENEAPVFRSLGLLRWFVWNKTPELGVMKFTEMVTNRVLRQYMSRKSSPYEVNSRGESALHIWVDFLVGLGESWGACENFFTSMTQLLLDAGLQIALCDEQGGSAGTRLLRAAPNGIVDFGRLMYILCKEAPEPSIMENYKISKFYFRSDWVEVSRSLRYSIDAINVVGCGPLSTAVILGKETEVKEIITRFPFTIFERNLLGQTPFHLAADKPRMLRLLMAVVNPQEHDVTDKKNDYALDYSLSLSSTICAKGSSWVSCSGCPCTECVEIFLDSGWRYRFDFLRADMSHAARLRMISHFAAQREVLKDLGRQFLPRVEIDRHRLNEPHILDIHAHRVAKLLYQRGIAVPASVWATLPTSEDSSSLFASMYYDTDGLFERDSRNRLVELLYDKGFRDFDEIDSRGHSPLSIYIGRDCFPRYYPRSSHCLWLIRHGADILRPWPLRDSSSLCGYKHSRWVLAHLVLDCIPFDRSNFRKNLDWYDSSDFRQSEVESYRQLVSLVAPLDQHDECHCRCGQAGCHTMKLFLRRAWDRSIHHAYAHHTYNPEQLITSSSVPNIATSISSFLRNLTVDLSKWDRVVALALRYFTFQTLDLQHTCCNVPYEGSLSEQEIMEIEDENREQLDRLELLLGELQLGYSNFKSPDVQGDKFTSFLTAEWSPRMQQELADMEAIRMTEDEKLKVEELGVRWGPEPEVRNEGESSDLDIWLKELDKIIPE
ncbi:hypothetical protein F5B22DRAFT_490884 [Xylaria bambusicola]|uniref:uncharacterized protein n=1 Tax=Xylaria bambusicola TaxID=326684 RepID=UPI002007B89D|nr:uncharacterized protein F5B22DRAFT_490884 [Xylaria bambusicola]KAI0505907.1 hypothetical protein F5B22DRAFT_490884 [Xylaria bambusicola]